MRAKGPSLTEHESQNASRGFAMKRIISLRALICLSLLAGPLVGACSDSDDKNDAACPAGIGGHDAAAGAGGMAGVDAATDGAAGAVDAGPLVAGDPQIAGVMVEANTGEVHAAEIALGRGMAASVRNFAQMMVTDHSMANQTLQMVLEAQGIRMTDSRERVMLSAMTSVTLNMLWAAAPAAFDLDYANSQVTMHMEVLNLLDTVLIPGAQNAALKANLQAERATVVIHLAAAQALVASLTTDGGVDGPAADGAVTDGEVTDGAVGN